MTPPYLTRARLTLARTIATLTLCALAALVLAPRAFAWLPADSGGAGLSSVTPSTDGGGSGLTGPAPRGSSGARHPRRPGPARSTPRGGSGELIIEGGGDGHGVGMSQYGAEGYALHGASAAEILAHYYRGTALGHADPASTVRVLIGTGRASFSGAARAGDVRLTPSSTYRVTASGLGLRILGPSGRTVATAQGTLTVTGPGPLSTAGRRYRGALSFSASPTGGVQTVNAVGLDDYVRGVVSEEMDASWAPAALEAQAIAARTYALTTSVDGSGYSLYDDTRSQMYGGVSAETATTDAAVTATSGQIVTYAGRPAVTYFFASSGGETESIQNVWPAATPEPWLVGVPDPYDAAAGDPYHHWTVRFSMAAADRRLGSLVRGRLLRIIVTHHGVSPRVITAQVIGTRGVSTVTGGELAQAFGLLSTDARFLVGRR
ncbi:MAG TPA: SpoIID/LytB domain-containing protein [Solirubrobacteraceae bacterium]|nr:SpoIID/LytB domain-containing protein [Solirubrobacteraceae bacterium]